MVWTQDICREIFEKKYMIHGEESPEALLEEVAATVASVEKTEERRAEMEVVFRDLLINGKLLPAGRILANARRNAPVNNLNNCFTITLTDSMEGIFDALKEDAMIQKQGGGVGFDLSAIRPKGAVITKGGHSSGTLSFLRIFNESAKAIHTGGDRRGAHIALLDVSHPDIEEFVTAKHGEENNELTQFNISVKVTDEFMRCVDADLNWDLVFEGVVYKTIKARDLFNKICHNAFTYNEPGLFFTDTVNRYNNVPGEYTISSCNPCGEQPLGPYQACCLAALNFTAFLAHEGSGVYSFDWAAYQTAIKLGVHFLDNVLDVTDYPLEKNREMAMRYRRIGLGFTGLADTLALLGMPYDSEEALAWADKAAKMLRDYSYEASVELARDRGPFPALIRDGKLDLTSIKDSEFIKKLPPTLRENIRKYGLRNVALNTIAPTGTISFSLGQNCSSGIEPIFSLQYTRTIRTGAAEGEDTRKETVWDFGWWRYVMDRAVKAETLTDTAARLLKGLYESGKNPYKTTMELDPDAHMKMQALWQEYIDSSIFKILNFSVDFDFADYGSLITKAHRMGLKGFTTFNPSGRMKGILEAPVSKKEEVAEEQIHRKDAPKRPKELPCAVHTMSYRGETYLILVGTMNGMLYEVFATLLTEELSDTLNSYKEGWVVKHGRGQYSFEVEVDGQRKLLIKSIGRAFNSTFEVVARMVSMAFRHGTPLQFIVDQLSKGKDMQGFERCLSRVIKKYIKDGEKAVAKCDTCHVQLEYREGCLTCPSCGTSKCG